MTLNDKTLIKVGAWYYQRYHMTADWSAEAHGRATQKLKDILEAGSVSPEA